MLQLVGPSKNTDFACLHFLTASNTYTQAMLEAATSLAGVGRHWSRHMRATISLNAPGGHIVADSEGAARHLALVQHEARRNLQHSDKNCTSDATEASSWSVRDQPVTDDGAVALAHLDVLHCEAAAIGALDGARVCHLPASLGVEAGVAQHQAEWPCLALHAQ